MSPRCLCTRSAAAAREQAPCCQNHDMQIQVLNQAVTPELREWILAQASGWDDEVIQ
jgi:hypothetical protein